ncbi:MAG TPA: DeoR/GlpR family DNA-binding transcription regulator [Clostridia bacterium]|nr:DeoR/GlpR family DNA-binding transcription regulator [Clostridia bacterium]
MFAEERLEAIENEVLRKGKVKVNDLAKKFNVSKATIRRDLTELETIGILKRTHGGAVPQSHTKTELSYLEKEDQLLNEKEKIGKYAAVFIKAGDTIALDSGTTTIQIAKSIDVEDITIITNSIKIANLLSKKNKIEVILTGGLLRQNTLALVGPLAEESVNHFNIDKAFLGANGITPDGGFTTPNIVEANIKKTFIKNSERVFFVCDHSKVYKKSFAKIAQMSEVDGLIIDRINEVTLKEFEKKGLNVLLIPDNIK